MSEKNQPRVAAVVDEGLDAGLENKGEAPVEMAVVAEEAAPEVDASTDDARAREASDREELRARNQKNLKRVGVIHGVAAVAALTLFGAAHTWAEASGWLLAGAVALAAAFIAGTALSALSHEWGHYSGALLSGSRYTVAKQPVRYFFMFNFDMSANSTRQAIWMSAGGLAGSWLLFVALALLVPVSSWPGAVLVATALGQAINASVFEVPIIRRTRKSGAFEQELSAQLESPGIVRMPGLIVGLLMVAAVT